MPSSSTAMPPRHENAAAVPRPRIACILQGMALRWQDVVALAKELPGVEEGVWFRTPSLRAGGRSFVRLKEDGKNVVFMLASVEEQEELVATMPKIFHLTPHYVGYAAVLARLSALTKRECRARLAVAFRKRAPRALVAVYDGVPLPPRRASSTKTKTKPKARAQVARARPEKRVARAR